MVLSDKDMNTVERSNIKIDETSFIGFAVNFNFN